MTRSSRASDDPAAASNRALPRLTWAGLLVLPMSAACAGADAGSDVLVRDSAGITIVENAAPGDHIARWSLGDAPEVVIGALDGPTEEQLFRVRRAVRLPDGRIAIANGGTNEIRFFDASGAYLETVGRDGEGPGEFRGLGRLLAFQDSFLVPDFRMRRVSVLGVDGTFARSFPFPRLDERSSAGITGIFGDGTLLVTEGRIFFAGRETSGVASDSSVYYRLDRTGTLVDTLGKFPGGDTYIHSDAQSMMVMALLFGRQPSATAAGSRFYYGSSDQYQIQVFKLDGTPERIIRLDRKPRAVTPADVERHKAEELEDVVPELRQQSERMLDAMPIPSTMPAFSDFEVDAKGNLWVESYNAARHEPTWIVFDPTGRLLAEIETPPQFTIFQIGADWVLGGRTDEIEVERVELYRLRREGS